MQMAGIPFGTTDWAAIAPTVHAGESGHAEPHRSRPAAGAKLFIVD